VRGCVWWEGLEAQLHHGLLCCLVQELAAAVRIACVHAHIAVVCLLGLSGCWNFRMVEAQQCFFSLLSSDQQLIRTCPSSVEAASCGVGVHLWRSGSGYV